ncbi:MAG: hypothetical protein H6983_07810 [Ectothiorhodospiraceae bacterium]|nr:hypothetical protein [Chromatiales bacterium]MCP5154052.1 hypothetical protein [Ectothiorhodospiraceae bacterium]
MSAYQLATDLFIAPTPAGAYFATSSPDDDVARRLLLAVMREDATVALDADRLRDWTGQSSEEEAAEVLYRAESVGWVVGEASQRPAPTGNMERDVPEMLEMLSGSGKALLADSDGFYLARAGFSHETAEELSALSADVAALHDRHRRLLRNNLSFRSGAWAVVDAAGNSQVGIWPLHVAEHHFSLVACGEPCFHVPEFLALVWTLARRYSR